LLPNHFENVLCAIVHQLLALLFSNEMFAEAERTNAIIPMLFYALRDYYPVSMSLSGQGTSLFIYFKF